MRLTLKDILQKLILLLNMSSHTLTHPVRSQEIGAPDTGALTAIFICWSDSTTGRPDLARATSKLTRFIDEDVVVKNEVGVTIDNEATGIDLGASGANAIDL
jgi:hypothetical protein